MSEKPLWAKTWADIAEGSETRTPGWVHEWNEKRRIREEENNQIVPVNREAYANQLSSAEALMRFGGSWLLLGTKRGRKITDKAQQGLLDFADNTFNEFGIRGRSLLPTNEVIGNLTSEITKAYSRLLPSDVLLPSQMDEKIDDETKILTKSIINGRLDGEYPTTDDEKKIAKEIIASIGPKSPKELNQIIRNHVYARAADIASARETNQYVQYHQQLHNGLRSLEKQNNPYAWIIADWVLTEVGMSKSEQKRMEQTVWGFTPSGIKAIRLSNLEDIIDVSFQDIGNDKKIQGKYLDWTEKIRSMTGRIPFKAVEQVRQKLGGIVNIIDYGRNESVAEFAVRDPKFTTNSIYQMAGLSQNYYNLLDKMKSALRNPESAYNYPVRPNRIIEQLPDPLCLELPARARDDGTLDWNSALDSMVSVKNRILTELRKRVLLGATRLSDQGEPVQQDAEAIEAFEKSIQSADEKMRRVIRLQAENDSIDCPYCGSNFRGVNCPACGAFHPILDKNQIYHE